MNPMCCGVPAHKNVISPNLSFWVCIECKQEVLELPPPEGDVFEGGPTNFFSSSKDEYFNHGD